ncbi:SIR2 family protein [Methylobacterium sp. E-065]|uniref:SIR2 family protein n=1 Tax=Methylobacterium sp. E-065 TaxID=2836583 RepID=UPI001FBA5FF5|nr:SIR2 family protein [Methylobacterium sp. E-065]MCJ2022056.1 SIR2 family protein [Methylobacterium sp. E-065]
MWLLGAGVSAAAGIPTAWDMIWRFKRELYVTQRKVSRQTLDDLAHVAVQALLDAFIAESETLPMPGAPEEYSALFEATYPQEQDRRTYIEDMVRNMKPTQGHLALAALMKAKHTNLVWTTNFDHLLADACARTYGTTAALSTASLDGSVLAGEFISEQQWPIEVKLHGDFRSRRLKNTGEELRHQDAKFRQQLIDACRRFGLIVAGYSGRDDSVMDALEAGLAEPGAYPGGLFWFHRGDNAPFSRVSRLLSRASALGVECGLIRIENFDEVMLDLLRLLPKVDTTHLRAEAQERRRFSFAPPPTGMRSYPLLRMNALPVTYPTNCRKVVCQIGGVKKVRELVDAADSSLIVTRSKSGVLGFGSDHEFRRLFKPFGIAEFGILTFEARRIRYDSQERNLLRRALVAAISKACQMDVQTRGHHDLLAPKQPSDERWDGLRNLLERISGSVPKDHAISWREGIGLRLDWASDQLWLLFEPRIVFTGASEATKAITSDFARERTARRYNSTFDKLVDYWSQCMAGENLRALGIGDGLDAVFTVGERTAFSRSVKP